jgi:hypothetical protein
MKLLIEPSGDLRCIYGEAIELNELGSLTIKRGSHLEPDQQGRWWADLTPAGGPALGPFSSRSLALAAEVDWLETHWLQVH